MYKPAANRRVPQAVMDARKTIMAHLLCERVCERCGGKGHLDNESSWIIVATTGRKTCFRCWGSGIEAVGNPDPLTVRYRHVTDLIPLVDSGDLEQILLFERKVRSSPYWPILIDVYERASVAAKAYHEDQVEDCLDGEELYDAQERYWASQW